jgi:hypothetical protein
MNYGTKFCRLSLIFLLPTILTSSLQFYPYQKDERALPGYLLTRCSFSLSDIKSFGHPYHHNVFTFTLFLQEGRAGVAWEPSNKMMLFLPPRKIKCLSLHPFISSLNLLFIYSSHISLSVSFGYKELMLYR